MNIDLLSPTILIVTTVLIALLLKLVWSKLWHEQPQRIWVEVITITISIGLAVLVKIIVDANFGQDSVPKSLILWALPMTIGLTLCVRTIRKKIWKICSLSILLILLGIILLSASLNNFFQYYPTLNEFINSLTNKPVNTKTVGNNITNSTLEKNFYPNSNQPKSGTLEPLNIPSSTPNFNPRQGYLYLPPAFVSNQQLKLPVLVLLAGYPGSPDDWKNHKIDVIMDEFAARHKGLAPIVAVVDVTGMQENDTECVNSKLGSVETYLAQDVPTYIKRNVRVNTNVSQWIIGGYSMGGTCSGIVALRNPTVYGSFMNIDGTINPSYGDSHATTLNTLFEGSQEKYDEHSPVQILQKIGRFPHPMNAWLFYGSSDHASLISSMKQFEFQAKQSGINVAVSSAPYGHTFNTWGQGFKQGLDWVSSTIGLT